jgi:hypothetical protein
VASGEGVRGCLSPSGVVSLVIIGLLGLPGMVIEVSLSFKMMLVNS